MRITDFTVDVTLAAIDDDSQMVGNDSELGSDLDGVYGLVESIDSINNNMRTYEPAQGKNQMNNDKKTSNEQNGQHSSSPDTETFSDALGGSLEDLVSHFDEKITHCFKDLAEDTENIAPVQMRSQDDIMNESQIWWTLTGNFGNILPIDWSKSCARKLQLPALHLQPKNETEGNESNEFDLSDDEELAQALDLHSLITSQMTSPEPPPQTADEVIEEIDEMMQQSYTSEWTACSDMTTTTDSFSCSPRKSPLVMSTLSFTQNTEDRARDAASIASSEESMWSLSYKDLAAVQMELEGLIQTYNEYLVKELALRGELEYEKELKNCFISFLLEVQNKRRQWFAEGKRGASGGKHLPPAYTNGELMPQYVTAIIPYAEGTGPPDNSTLERLVKILQSVNENSPGVPNMLTDYILNVICPSTRPLYTSAW